MQVMYWVSSKPRYNAIYGAVQLNGSGWVSEMRNHYPITSCYKYSAGWCFLVPYSFLGNRCIQCPNVEEEEHDDQLTDQYLAGGSEAFDDTEAQGVENSGDTAK